MAAPSPFLVQLPHVMSFSGGKGPSVGRRARLSAGNVLSLGDDARGLRKGYG